MVVTRQANSVCDSPGNSWDGSVRCSDLLAVAGTLPRFATLLVFVGVWLWAGGCEWVCT